MTEDRRHQPDRRKDPRIGWITREKWGWLVGCRGPKQDDGSQYRGPTAQVSYDEDWLHIITDDSEGHAMLNIEALPQIREALAAIAKERRAKAKP